MTGKKRQATLSAAVALDIGNAALALRTMSLKEAP
jgi:hypothetical protein